MQNSGTFKVTTPSDRELMITRVFDAPRKLVFKALTTPELLKRWLSGPPGWSMEVCEVDLRVGGSYRFVWSGRDGKQMGMGGAYLEVVPPERYVATELFDEAWYPGAAVVTTNLVEQNGKTTMTLSVLYESREVRDGVLKSPMEQGVALGYDKLEALLGEL
jgi:uncharacterized protein YndB with AHSA1/START domain